MTLIEVLMALGTVAVLFGVAVPALSGASEATHAMQARTELMSSYQAALNGAVMSNARSTLCPSNDGNACSNGDDWSRGWIAFVDTNADREHQSDEPIVFRQPALPGKLRLHSTAGRTRIEIQADGSVAGSNVTFTLCDGRGATKAQSLVLSNKSILVTDTATAAAAASTCLH
ncbi:MAG TPA: GspH/FimT family pseudopilin [Xanthomonadaceae bacterium]